MALEGRKINFAAGPAKLPEEVLLKMQEEQLNFNNLGVSVIGTFSTKRSDLHYFFFRNVA